MRRVRSRPDVAARVKAEKTISRRRGLIADDHCRTPGRPLDGPESADVDRFLEEFADLLPALDGTV
jgi:hypothetical protein